RTKAIIAVHLGGHPADVDCLCKISARHSIPLVEDCAHAHSSEWRGRRVGTFGVAGTFSFQASKLMTAGEGGAIITNDDEVEHLARSVHDCGRMPGQWFYSHYIYGSNYRLSAWQGAVPNAQRAFSEAIWIPQPALLGDEEDMEEVAAAVSKLQGSAAELASTWESWSLLF